MAARPDSSEWFIAGNGAVGMSLAYRLHLHDVPTYIIPRSKQPNPMNLTYRMAGEDAVQWSCPTVFESTGVVIERLVVATKAFSVSDVLGKWGACLTPNARIYFLQNGRDFASEDGIPDSIRRMVVVNTGFAAYRDGEHGAVQTAFAPLWVGDEAGSTDPPDMTVAEDLQMLVAAGLPVKWTPKVTNQRWLKMAVNAVINPLTVLFNCTNGELLQDPEAIDLVRKMSEESGALFEAMEIPVSRDDIHSSIQGTLAATARNYSSMLQDFRRGTGDHELDFINFPLLTAAAKHAVKMPTHEEIYDRACRLLGQKRKDVGELT